MSYYALYEPASPGDGDMSGPHHTQKEAHTSAKNMVALINAGLLAPGKVTVIDEAFNTVENLDTTSEAW